jgi:hypothetical protein
MRGAVLVLALLLPLSAHAQRPQVAIVPDSITVGDVFHAAIRIDLPEGARLVAPDSLQLPADLESAGRREVRFDTAAAARRTTLLYPLTAWRPGTYELPVIALRIVQDGTETPLDAVLPPITVTSVLPPDTAGIEPKPAKDVLGANRLWWPILLALLAALLLAVALYIWWRRRRRPADEAVFTPAAPAHEVALAQLAALAREGLHERGDFRRFYERLTAILRHYAQGTDARWSVDLTTSELAARLRADLDAVNALEMVRILGAADLVKFARATTTRDSAARDIEAARAWIERTAPAPAPAPGTPDERRAA